MNNGEVNDGFSVAEFAKGKAIGFGIGTVAVACSASIAEVAAQFAHDSLSIQEALGIGATSDGAGLVIGGLVYVISKSLRKQTD
ncbi:MAG: hypothetical protein WDN27_07030 [Candidatus Saccharibacteria bacterium]